MKTMDAWIQNVDDDLFSTKKQLSAFPPVFAFEFGRPIFQEWMSLLEEERKNERESNIPPLKASPMETKVQDQSALHDLKASSATVEPSTFKGYQSESEDELLQCGHCFREFPRKSYLEMHIEEQFSINNSSENISEKEHCAKTFTTSESLEFNPSENEIENSNGTERSDVDSYHGNLRMFDLEQSFANTFQQDISNFVKEALENEDIWQNWE